jgi:uncharacterized repeat protein (TIGR04076 family)
MALYCADLKGVAVQAHLSKKKCGYCKSGKESYGSDGLVPKGFCPDAFYAVYPYLLAVLYDAKLTGEPFAENLIISCPNPHKPALVKVTFRPKKAKVILNLIEGLSRAIGFPKDAIDKVVTLEVVSENQECGLKKGDSFKVNIPNLKEVCPAAFFSMYPLINLCSRDIRQGAAQPGGDTISFVCPDPKTNIIYDVSVPGKAPPTGSAAKNKPCDYIPDMSKYKIAVHKYADCRVRFWHEKEIRLNNLIPSGLCPFMFNVAIPYAVTLYNGGHFKWRKDINTVEAQCPSCEGQVAFEIKRDKSDSNRIDLNINKVGGCCPKNHRKDESYSFDFSKVICPHLFVRIFPALLLLEYGNIDEKHKKELMIHCPFTEKDAAYRLYKE